MTRSLTIIIIFLITVSCQNNSNEVYKRSIDFIQKQNLKLSQEIFESYLAKGKRKDERQVYDNTQAIISSKNVLNKYYDNGKLQNELLIELKKHKKILDSISILSQYNNQSNQELIRNNLRIFEKNPFDFLLALSLYENELLYHNAFLIGGIGTLFTSSILFSKREYQRNEEVLFTNTVFEIDYYEDFEYDSISFLLKDKKMNISYSLEQIVNTAIVKFKPSEPGIYTIDLHSSFDTHLQNRRTEKISTSIEIR